MNKEPVTLTAADDQWILNFIPNNASVLDLGCGNGNLLHALNSIKNAKGRGVEIDEDHVITCIKKGIPIFQGNIEEGLKEYPDQSYDFVILNQTLQNIYHTEFLLGEMLHVGRRAVVSLPNFAHWRIRIALGIFGRLPVTRLLHYEWYNTPNIRLFTVNDFKTVCRKKGLRVTHEFYTAGDRPLGLLGRCCPNLFCETAVFVLELNH
ncbi:MAG: methionine biosynthesis protein MetW [Fibrobacterota bacterium]